MPTHDLNPSTLVPLAVVLNNSEYQTFTAWLREDAGYTAAERQTLSEALRGLRLDPGNQAHASFLNDLLEVDPVSFLSRHGGTRP
ncbi:MAG: hypothetical protein LBK59_05020 [Bifidobacteriaceae bacterium]|nr:hypothetical protein [Bifidobacteriaceae bacterium]